MNKNIIKSKIKKINEEDKKLDIKKFKMFYFLFLNRDMTPRADPITPKATAI